MSPFQVFYEHSLRNFIALAAPFWSGGPRECPAGSSLWGRHFLIGRLYEGNQNTVSPLNRRQFQQPDLLSVIDGWHRYQRHSQLLKIKNVS